MTNNKHKKYTKEALRLSEESVKSGGGPFGAVVVKDGEIVGCGKNSVAPQNDPTAHAEVMAIRNACENLGNRHLSGCVLYASTEPCPMCFGAIYWARLDAVYIANTRKDASGAGFDDEFIYEEINLPFEKRKIPFHQIKMKEAQKALLIWKESRNKTEY